MFLPHHFISNKGKGIPLMVQFPRSMVVMEPKLCSVCAVPHTWEVGRGGKEGKAHRGPDVAQQSRTKGQKGRHLITYDWVSGY